MLIEFTAMLTKPNVQAHPRRCAAVGCTALLGGKSFPQLRIAIALIISFIERPLVLGATP